MNNLPGAAAPGSIKTTPEQNGEREKGGEEKKKEKEKEKKEKTKEEKQNGKTWWILINVDEGDAHLRIISGDIECKVGEYFRASAANGGKRWWQTLW